MVDRLIDVPNWWSHFTHPPQRRVSEFRPSSSSSSSSDHSSSSDSNNSMSGEFCCFVDDIHILNNHKAFVIIDGEPELETCSLSEDLVNRLVKLGLSQKSPKSQSSKKTVKKHGPVSGKKRTQFRQGLFRLGSPKKQRSKKRLKGQREREKPPHLRYYLQYLNRMTVANVSLSKYIKVVVFLVNSLLKRLHLQLVKYDDDLDDVSSLSELLTFRVTPLYGNTLFLSTTQSTTTTKTERSKCSFDTKVLLQCKDRSSYDSKLH